jgi:hypothetical protein
MIHSLFTFRNNPFFNWYWYSVFFSQASMGRFLSRLVTHILDYRKIRKVNCRYNSPQITTLLYFQINYIPSQLIQLLSKSKNYDLAMVMTWKWNMIAHNLKPDLKAPCDI